MSSALSDNLTDLPRDDLDLSRTMEAVNWKGLLERACYIFKSETAEWGATKRGSFNVVRFLHLRNTKPSVAVVRVPVMPPNGWQAELRGNPSDGEDARRSEIATMQFIEVSTTVPVPHIFDYQVSAEGHSALPPYIIMSKLEGAPLSSSWKDMNDANRARILEQVANILVEISSHRFDRIGFLLPTQGPSSDHSLAVRGILMNSSRDATMTRTPTFSSAMDAALSEITTQMQDIMDHPFFSPFLSNRYVRLWFIRSLIPSLIDSSLDTAGFPIMHGDFHSQNIMIVNGDHGPTISGLIDWDMSRTQGTNLFAQFPLFIVDHPLWAKDNPLRRRNLFDQETFLGLIKKAEVQLLPEKQGQLYGAYRGCRGIYLGEQIIHSGDRFEEILWPELVDWVEGTGEDSEGSDDGTEGTDIALDANAAQQAEVKETCPAGRPNPETRHLGGCEGQLKGEHAVTSTEFGDKDLAHRQYLEILLADDKDSFVRRYLKRLRTRGVLKEYVDRLRVDLDVFFSAQDIIGEDLVDYEMSRSNFLAVLQNNRESISHEEKVLDWLRSNEAPVDGPLPHS